jgi:hypothetical protein
MYFRRLYEFLEFKSNIQFFKKEKDMNSVGLQTGPRSAASRPAAACLARWPKACGDLAQLGSARGHAPGPVTAFGTPVVPWSVGGSLTAPAWRDRWGLADGSHVARSAE